MSSTTLADVFPAEPFNGLQISYSVSGAGLAAPKDSEGFTFYREMDGKLTGNELTVSGTAKAGNGWGATIDVRVSVDGQEPKSFHQEKFPKNGLAEDVMNQPFSVTVPVPAQAQEASFTISLEGSYNAGSRGVVVEGSLNRSYSLPVTDTKNETEPAGKEQGCQDGSTCPKKSLCAEAILRYFPLSPEKGAEYGSLRWDYEDLKQEWEKAIDDYNENHDTKAHSSDNALGILPAISWLWAEGGTSDMVSKSFVFTSDEDRSKFSSRTPREDEATQGTEYALYYAIVNKFKDKNSKLTPGDVFNLALEQRNGDAREAILLAHNLFRSLARTGDQSLTMVPVSLNFFDTYLEPMVGQESLGKGQNAGDWYHLFGTAYFEMQGRGNWGFYTPVEMVVDRGVGDGLDKIVNLFQTDPELKEPSSRTLLSFLGNEVEQGVRWAVGSPSDPEKYCFNVWGGQLGAWLYREKLPKETSGEPTQEEGSSTLTVPTILGPIPMVPDSRRIMDEPSRVVYSGSPVNVLWEGDGKSMALDQVQESLEGDFPVGLIPFYEAQTESWGLLWKELSDAAYKVSFEAVKEGWHHLVIVDKKINQTQVYFVYLLPGERTSLEIDPSGKPSDMTGPKGEAIKPLILGPEGTEISDQEEGGAKESQIIFDNTNIAAVDNNPICNPSFTIAESQMITYIETYHWNYGQGTEMGGTIALEKDDGTTYGPWTVQTDPGMNGVPNAYWKSHPSTVIPAGTYTIIDSDSSTWSQNFESGGCGFGKVEGYSASSNDGSKGTTAKESQTIFDNSNIAAVDNNPICDPSFTIAEPQMITYIETYHWNYGQGTGMGGMISLEKDDGTIYGPWTVQTDPGMNGVPNAYWKCHPDTVIPAGTYTIIDSDPSTWSQNYESGGCGFSKVEGYSASSDEGSGIVIEKPPENDESVVAPGGTGCDWTGTWNTDWGEMILQQSGNEVNGTYTHDQGRIQATVSGGRLAGTWSEAPSYSPTSDAGDVELTMSQDCRSFSGNWRYGSNGGWSGGWVGSRL